MTLAVALRHAARGRPVLPLHGREGGSCTCPRGAACASAGKHPRTRRGLLEATTDETTIRGWWRAWPSSHVGMVTGRFSRCVVLDVDPRHGGDDALHELERAYESLPKTLSVCTRSGGQHLYFRDPGGLPSSAGKVGAGLDVRADGAYVVAVGTPGYDVDDDHPIAPMPGWLEQLARGGRGGEARRAAAVAVELPEGLRRQALLSLAGSMRRRGLTAGEMLPTLAAVNRRRCRPPLSDHELEHLALDVDRRYPAADDLGAGRAGGWPLGRRAA